MYSARLLCCCSLLSSQPEGQGLGSDLDPCVVVLNLVTNSFLVGASAAPKEGSDAESIVLGRDHLFPAHSVHACQVLLVHNVLLDRFAGTRLVCGLQPRKTEDTMWFVIADSQLNLLRARCTLRTCWSSCWSGNSSSGDSGGHWPWSSPLDQGRPWQNGWSCGCLRHGLTSLGEHHR